MASVTIVLQEAPLDVTQLNVLSQVGVFLIDRLVNEIRRHSVREILTCSGSNITAGYP
jgi:hypothetical protein